MRLDWVLLSPAGPYAALAIGLSLCLFLFLTLKRDLRVGEARWRTALKILEANLDAKAAALEERVIELSHISGLLVAPEPPRSGLNLTKRSQALQMSRRGATPPDIALTLSIPQNEVELLVKVHQSVLSRLDAPATRASGL